MKKFIKDPNFLHIAGTGHRPNKIPGGYERYAKAKNSGLEYIAELCMDFLKKKDSIKVISGMAQGWDTGLAIAALTMDLPLIAAVPCRNQPERWPRDAQSLYNNILDQADEVFILAEEYSRFAMFDRNTWMVNNCDEVLACWDGIKKGGTYHCVTYANTKGKPITNLYGS
jgi:uncharacterized phage-like protein YoqJ